MAAPSMTNAYYIITFSAFALSFKKNFLYLQSELTIIEVSKMKSQAEILSLMRRYKPTALKMWLVANRPKIAMLIFVMKVRLLLC